MQCPKCDRSWDSGTEQALCIERHGECVPCYFIPSGEHNPTGSGAGIAEEFDALRDAHAH